MWNEWSWGTCMFVALLPACKSAPVPQLPSGSQHPVPTCSHGLFPSLPLFPEPDLDLTLNPTWAASKVNCGELEWVLVNKVHFLIE